MKKWRKLFVFFFVIMVTTVFFTPASEVKAAGDLKKAKIISLRSREPGKIVVKCSKAKGCKYQIQIAVNSKMTKGRKTFNVSANTKKISLTKGKKYYVRVRTYKKMGRKTKFSKWSGKKTVRVKKDDAAENKKKCRHEWKKLYTIMPMHFIDVAGCNYCGYPLFDFTEIGAIAFDDKFSHPEYCFKNEEYPDGYKCTGSGWHTEYFAKGYCTYCQGLVEYRQCAFGTEEDALCGSNECMRNLSTKTYVKVTCEPSGRYVLAADEEHPDGYYVYQRVNQFTGYYHMCSCGKNKIVPNEVHKYKCNVETGKYRCIYCGQGK